MRGAEVALALLMLWAEVTPAPELVFRVPEVLVRSAAAARPVGSGPAAAGVGNASALVAGDDDNLAALVAGAGAASSPLDAADYFVEHEVTRAEATKAAMLLKLSDVAESLPGCGTCGPREQAYCQRAALWDHCCCERRYMPEPLPWRPHRCYLGPRRCRPRAPSCAHYARLRDCCCLRPMAEHWKSELSSAQSWSQGRSAALALAAVAALAAAHL